MSVLVKITLRTYRQEDFETLYEIDQACYPADTAYSRSELRSYLGFVGGECVVAETDETSRSEGEPLKSSSSRASKIAGFCVSVHRGHEGYIVTIDVLDRYRREGIGSALLEEVERRLAEDGVRRVALETAVDSPAAIAFWQRHGYRTRGVRKGYYPRGRDAYSMTKTIRSNEGRSK